MGIGRFAREVADATKRKKKRPGGIFGSGISAKRLQEIDEAIRMQEMARKRAANKNKGKK
jgi:hypothetical protein